MFKIRLGKMTEEQRDKWLGRVLPLIAGKSRREAYSILFDLGNEKYEEIKEKAKEQDVSSMVAIRYYGDIRKINRVIMYQVYPYTPEYQAGVVPPKGGPYDMTLKERFRLDDDGSKVKDGQLTTQAFESNRKHVTVSVEGFDKPVKLKTKALTNKHRSWLPTIFGYIILDDIEYVFTPGENKQVYYGDEGKIDEGKPWGQVGEPRPLDEWELRRQAHTAKARATQLTKAEKAYLDDHLFNMVKDWEEKREEDYQQLRKAAEGKWWGSDIKRGAVITIPIMGDLMESFKWPDEEPSEKARGAFSYHKKYGYEDRFSESMIRNSLNRLLRKEVITKYSEERGKPAEYWIREQDNE